MKILSLTGSTYTFISTAAAEPRHDCGGAVGASWIAAASAVAQQCRSAIADSFKAKKTVVCSEYIEEWLKYYGSRHTIQCDGATGAAAMIKKGVKFMENSTTIKNNSEDIIALATEKIKAEFEKFSGGTKEKAVSSYVSAIIQDFCKQDKRFAEVVYKFKRTLSDCCADVMHGVGSHISDIDVYRSAVKFYFPNSEISMNMSIEITGEAPGNEEILKEAEKPKQAPKPKTKPKSETKPKKKAAAVGEADQHGSERDSSRATRKKEVIQLSMF